MENQNKIEKNILQPNAAKPELLITNLHEWNELAKQFVEICQKINAFEFKFNT